MNEADGGVVQDLAGNNDLQLQNGAEIVGGEGVETPTVAENNVGTVVATLTASDPDVGDNATFSLSEDASGLFEVVGNELKLKDGVSLDHETQDSYEVAVQVEDSSGATYTETVTINVVDVNEGPVVIDVDLGATNEDTDIVITEAQLLAQSMDPEGATLSIQDVSVDPAFGALVDNGDGTWAFSPTDDLSIQNVEFSFSATDGTNVESGTATLDINAVADAPTVTIGAVEQVVLGGENTVSSGFEGGNIDTSQSGSAWLGSIGDWQTSSEKIEVKQEALSDGTTNQFVELNDDAVNYYDDATNIHRTIDTQDGATYTVDFEYAPRPGYGDNVNEIEVVVNGQVVDTISADGTGDSSINWQTGSYTFTGDGSEMTLEFRTSGEAQAYGRGMYMDDISITEEMPSGVVSGSNGGPIVLPDISVSSADADGSEAITTTISEIPDGFIITDGDNTFTAIETSDGVDVSNWNLHQLTITPSDGYTGEVNLTVTATSTDGSSQAQSSDTVTINVQSNDDVLYGTNSADIIDGGDGNDTIIGGAGNDYLYGGDGADIFVYDMGDGSDMIDGGVGGWTDSIQIEGGISALGELGVDWTVELTQGTIVSSDSESVVFSDDADGVVTFSDGATLEFENLEQII
ncbi:MAG: DUF642 domain-containing protein, partial [Alphaproteobacteria bacterium]|nr:DUF642 domain-containing protein [Alphaproteobacteria bacterium]